MCTNQVPPLSSVGVEAQIHRTAQYVFAKGEKAVEFICDHAEAMLEWTIPDVYVVLFVYACCQQKGRLRYCGSMLKLKLSLSWLCLLR